MSSLLAARALLSSSTALRQPTCAVLCRHCTAVWGTDCEAHSAAARHCLCDTTSACLSTCKSHHWSSCACAPEQCRLKGEHVCARVNFTVMLPDGRRFPVKGLEGDSLANVLHRHEDMFGQEGESCSSSR